MTWESLVFICHWPPVTGSPGQFEKDETNLLSVNFIGTEMVDFTVAKWRMRDYANLHGYPGANVKRSNPGI